MTLDSSPWARTHSAFETYGLEEGAQCDTGVLGHGGGGGGSQVRS